MKAIDRTAKYSGGDRHDAYRDGHSRFLAPPVVADHRTAPVNALGYLRVMITVEEVDGTLVRLSKSSVQLVGASRPVSRRVPNLSHPEPEGILIGLA